MTSLKTITDFLGTIPAQASEQEIEQQARDYFDEHPVEPTKMSKAAKKFVARDNALDPSIVGASEVFKAAAALKRVREDAAAEGERNKEIDVAAEDEEARRLLAQLRNECRDIGPRPAQEAPTRYEAEVDRAIRLLGEQTGTHADLQHNLMRGWLTEVMVKVGGESEQDVLTRVMRSKAKKLRNSTAVSRPKALYKLLSEHQMYRLRHWRPQQVTTAQVVRLSPAIVRILTQNAEERNWWQADAPDYTEQGHPVKRWISLGWLLHGHF